MRILKLLTTLLNESNMNTVIADNEVWEKLIKLWAIRIGRQEYDITNIELW